MLKLTSVMVTLFWTSIKVWFTFYGLYLIITTQFDVVPLLMFIAGSTMKVKAPAEREAIWSGGDEW